MNIYLICGKAGSGKNEVADYLCEKLDNSVITAFSKYIKMFALELTDWDGTDGHKPRKFLQEMGDNLRAIDPNFLTKRMKEDIEVYELKGIKNVIISDVRLLNEVEYFKKIKKYNVITIRVNSEVSTRVLTEEQKMHHTETELDNYKEYNYVIENAFDRSLYEYVDKIVEGR